ncbi:MAG: PfkB family carbohydrate kinase [Candidatus Njordarchaeia archaeon]
MERFLIVGSVAIDNIDGSLRCGGSATYVPIPLIIMDADFRVIGTIGKDFPWDFSYPGEMLTIDKTISFKHVYMDNKRMLWIINRPDRKIEFSVEDQFDAVIVSPLINEFSHKSILQILDNNNFTAVDLQGFLRKVREDGSIYFDKPSRDLIGILNNADIVTASDEEYIWSERIGKIFILTMGYRGAKAFTSSGEIYVPTVKVDKTPVGAGDMFISSFVYFKLRGFSTPECLIHANALTSALIELLPVRDHCLGFWEIKSIKNDVLRLYRDRVNYISDMIKIEI